MKTMISPHLATLRRGMALMLIAVLITFACSIWRDSFPRWAEIAASAIGAVCFAAAWHQLEVAVKGSFLAEEEARATAERTHEALLVEHQAAIRVAVLADQALDALAADEPDRAKGILEAAIRPHETAIAAIRAAGAPGPRA